MQTIILVTYASKHGATGEIAETIGEALRQANFKVVVLPVQEAGDLDRFTAVVLGSAVYAGQWVREAADFLKINTEKLAGKPFWIFSSGPTGEGDPMQLVKGWRFPQALEAVIDHVRPRDIAIFHGELDTKKLNFAERLIIRGVKAPTGDYRDWEAIAAWAKSIADALSKEVAQP